MGNNSHMDRGVSGGGGGWVVNWRPWALESVTTTTTTTTIITGGQFWQIWVLKGGGENN